MASSSHQKGNVHFISNSPYFFKIILQDTIQNGKLGIPRKFVKIYGDSMSSPAMLRVPSGAVWKVDLTKCDGRIWLEKGWLEFSKHNSLDSRHLLVFRYDGNSNFHVIIFDRSASEIQYPHTSNNHRPSNEIPEQTIDNSDDVDNINILENIPPSRKMRKRSQSPCPRPHKMIRITNSGSAIRTETECNRNNEFQAQQVRPNGCSTRKYDKSTSHNKIQIKAHESFKALERASNTFESENPFFLVYMHPSYLGQDHSKNYRLSMPANFVNKHLMKEHCSITLFNSSGKAWIVTFKKKQFRNQLRSQLQNGWGAFVRDNNIQIGDVCVFELINSIEISFKVVIYKVQHPNCHQSFTSTDVFRPVRRKPQSYAGRIHPEPVSALEKAKAFQLASAFKSENPYFIVVLHPSYVHSSKLSIPVNFARQYLTKMHNKVILLLSNGKSWPVTYYQQGPKPNLIFRNGWRKFAGDNNLEVGDACAFELIKGAEMSMKVTIYKKQAVEDANLGSSLDDISEEKQVEVHEGLVIKSEESARINGDYSCDAFGEILDDILMSKNSCTGKALGEGSQSCPTLQIEAIQDTKDAIDSTN